MAAGWPGLCNSGKLENSRDLPGKERPSETYVVYSETKPSRALGRWATSSFQGHLIGEVFEGEGYVES